MKLFFFILISKIFSFSKLLKKFFLIIKLLNFISNNFININVFEFLYINENNENNENGEKKENNEEKENKKAESDDYFKKRRELLLYGHSLYFVRCTVYWAIAITITAGLGLTDESMKAIAEFLIKIDKSIITFISEQLDKEEDEAMDKYYNSSSKSKDSSKENNTDKKSDDDDDSSNI